MDKYVLPLVSQTQLAQGVYRLVLDASPLREEPQPGQFFHLRCGEGSEMVLRRPLSLCDFSSARREVHLVYRVEGNGTAWLAKRHAGEGLDLLGPLGTPFPVHEGRHALLIGGGIGVPPLLYTARLLRRAGVRSTAVLGFPDRSRAFLGEDFARLTNRLVATEDGSLGTRGRVTDVLQQEPERWQDVDLVYSCGPTPMLRAVKEWMGSEALPSLRQGYLSLEERMGCGVGACLACFCPVEEGAAQGRSYRKICSDGPVFDYREIALGSGVS